MCACSAEHPAKCDSEGEDAKYQWHPNWNQEIYINPSSWCPKTYFSRWWCQRRGWRRWLMFYRHWVRVLIEDLPSFIEEGSKVRALFDHATSWSPFLPNRLSSLDAISDIHHQVMEFVFATWLAIATSETPNMIATLTNRSLQIRLCSSCRLTVVLPFGSSMIVGFRCGASSNCEPGVLSSTCMACRFADFRSRAKRHASRPGVSQAISNSPGLPPLIVLMRVVCRVYCYSETLWGSKDSDFRWSLRHPTKWMRRNVS